MTRTQLRTFVRYMRDALNRFQVEQERAGVGEDTFDMWWRRLHHHVRSERPRLSATASPPPGTRCDPTSTSTRRRRGA